MSEVKIIEYNPLLAKKISEMWQRSSGQPGWNGEIFNFTEETVLQEQAKSSNLNLFLAETDDKIVGYCTLKVYSEDIGALYIGLLNVEPEYMSKKIGKMLVLKCVERTIELGYPRLDLFTWAGNTKAMPLYKKCGFFWEEMERSTHLMNFIPTVMNEDIFKEYFKKADWYEDSKRVIDLVPDARKENKFEYFKYAWEKDGHKLEVDFERRGRGLRRIDCEDYSIEAVVENLELVFGSSYKVKYIVKNKSGKELNVSIKGLNDRNIDFSYTESSKVENEKIFEGEFFVNKVNHPQNIWKTHPVVKSEIVINGIKTIFMVGIEPHIPLSIEVVNKTKLDHPGNKCRFHLNIENNYDNSSKFSFKLPNNDLVEIINGDIDIDLKKKEKISLELEYIAKKAGIYIPEIKITVKPEGGEEFVFSKKVVMVFNMENESFTGKTEKNHVIGNDRYCFYLGYNIEMHNRLNEGILIDTSIDRERFVFLEPKLGKPYKDEFIKREPEKVITFKRDNYVQMSAHYRTERSEFLEFITHYRLYPNGKFIRWNEFIKTEELEENIYLTNNFWLQNENCYIPINKSVIKSCNRIGNEFSYWQGIDLSENWLYTFGEKFKTAFIWPESTKLTIGEWMLSYEFEIPKEKGKYFTDKEMYYCEAPSDWKDIRRIATGKDSKDEKPVESFEIMINVGNPVIKAENELKTNDISKKTIKGKQIISSGNGKIVHDNIEIDLNSYKDSVMSNFSYEGKSASDLINIHSDFRSFEYFDKKLVFAPTGVEIKTSKDNGCVQTDNGMIVIKSDEKFAPALFSLTYNGKEWLDTFYPKTGPKSWWGYWFGGLSILPNTVSNKTLLEQKTNADPVKVKDNFGNEWTGIRINTEFTEYEKLKGYSSDQYFMMLPGVPVLWTFTKVHNDTGKYQELRVETKMFAKASDDLGKHYFIQPSTGYKFNAGGEMLGIKSEKSIILTEESRDEFVNIYSADEEKIGSHLDTYVCLISSSNKFECSDKQSKLVGSKFFIFRDDKLKAEWLADLDKIKPII